MFTAVVFKLFDLLTQLSDTIFEDLPIHCILRYFQHFCCNYDKAAWFQTLLIETGNIDVLN